MRRRQVVPCKRPERMWSGSPSTARRTPRPWPRFGDRRRPTCRSTCRRTIGWPSWWRRMWTRSATTRGILYHHERDKPWQEKVEFLAEVAAEHDCAMRVGVNCGSVDPARNGPIRPPTTPSRPCWKAPGNTASCWTRLGFTRYCVSLKDSDPRKVIEVNRRFAEQRPDVPLHLGVTEAGCRPTAS